LRSSPLSSFSTSPLPLLRLARATTDISLIPIGQLTRRLTHPARATVLLARCARLLSRAGRSNRPPQLLRRRVIRPHPPSQLRKRSPKSAAPSASPRRKLPLRIAFRRFSPLLLAADISKASPTASATQKPSARCRNFSRPMASSRTASSTPSACKSSGSARTPPAFPLPNPHLRLRVAAHHKRRRPPHAPGVLMLPRPAGRQSPSRVPRPPIRNLRRPHRTQSPRRRRIRSLPNARTHLALLKSHLSERCPPRPLECGSLLPLCFQSRHNAGEYLSRATPGRISTEPARLFSQGYGMPCPAPHKPPAISLPTRNFARELARATAPLYAESEYRCAREPLGGARLR